MVKRRAALVVRLNGRNLSPFGRKIITHFSNSEANENEHSVFFVSIERLSSFTQRFAAGPRAVASGLFIFLGFSAQICLTIPKITHLKNPERDYHRSPRQRRGHHAPRAKTERIVYFNLDANLQRGELFMC